MTSIRFPEFLLLLFLLLLQQVYSEEAEPVFRPEGNVIEMGYCFGVDYIVVYRCAPEGDQLLGNSSANIPPVTPPVDLQGRIHINEYQHLLGLQISNLTHKDSGTYRRECWQNQTLVSQHTNQLIVCDEELESEEIIVKEEHGRVELQCKTTSTGLEGTSVRWYYEMYPTYRPTLFLDSSVSLDPLVEELRGAVEVKLNGVLLLLHSNMLKNNQQFYCLVSKGKTCLSFQNMHPPDRSESREIFASQGETVELKCSSDGENQQWETPMGKINHSSGGLLISFGAKSEEFSLVIPEFSDEHSGEYSCISSSLEVQYLLVLCPKKDSQRKVAFEGESVSLDCDFGKNESQSVQWLRKQSSGDHELLHDSDDKTVPIPPNLRGRLTVSGNGSSLTISHLVMNDQGVYWCVVLGEANEFLEKDDDYEGDYNEGDTDEDELNVGQYWDDTHSCISKQETVLTLSEILESEGSDPVNSKPGTTNDNTDRTADPPATNATAYAVGAGLVGLLVVGVIVAVIVIRRRANASRQQGGAASNSGQNTNDNTANKDPGCTQRLTDRDDENVA